MPEVTRLVPCSKVTQKRNKENVWMELRHQQWQLNYQGPVQKGMKERKAFLRRMETIRLIEEDGVSADAAADHKSFLIQSEAEFRLIDDWHIDNGEWIAVICLNLLATKTQLNSNQNFVSSLHKLTVKPATMANRPSLALIFDNCRLNYVEDCMKTKKSSCCYCLLFVLLFIPESHGTGSKKLPPNTWVSRTTS